jgi:hypothetical protein
LAKKLVHYLGQYKKSWGGRYVASRARIFAGRPVAVSWNLNTDVRFEGDISRVYQEPLRRRLSEAWDILTGLIHPALLETLPPVTIKVEAGCTRPSHAGTTIRLGPSTTLETILHEFGHHIEVHGGIRLFAMAQAAR